MLSFPPTSSSISRKKYDVFLSFRGEDTRRSFTDHLYNALNRSGIVTFRDDLKLEAGEEIGSGLFKAIQQSWCSVVIFSESYAFSCWCLDELAEIVKQEMEMGHKVFPIFYGVDPSDLRKQKGKVEEAFARHQERCREDRDKIRRWQDALTHVTNIKGWHLNNRNESEFIADIVKKISARLCQTYPVVSDELVGISSHLENLHSKIEIGEDDATEAIEGMIIDVKRDSNQTRSSNADAFLKMKRLRLLRVLHLSNCGDLTYLSNELRLLDWMVYPLRSLPSSFEPDNLVALLLPHSHIEQLWPENIVRMNSSGLCFLAYVDRFFINSSCFQQPMYKLKVIDLKGSNNLIKTPDFGMAPNLESLGLEGCTRLVNVHPSIGVHSRLKVVNFGGCKSLGSLPAKIGMESLEKLTLSGCSNLKSFPEIDGNMECLFELYLDGTSIEELPSSIGKLSSLVLLNVQDCSSLVSLPSSLGGCERLRTLDISGCSKVENLPEILQQVKLLENLKVSSFKGCSGPSKTRRNLPSLFKLIRRGRTNSTGWMLPSVSGLRSLKMLNLRDCNLCEGDIPTDISCLSSLKSLDLGGNNFISIPSSLTLLSNLQYLGLENCRALNSLPELPESIEKVRMDGCESLELVVTPSKIRNSTDRAWFRGTHCYRLAENINALTLLKKHLKVFANSRKIFDVIIPGNEIPEWFSHQGVGSSIKLPLPLDIRNDGQWMGVAFCCNFTNDDASMDEYIMCKAVIHGRNSGHPRIVNESGFDLGKQFNQPVTRDHLFLRYWSCDRLYPSSLEDNKCDELETESLSTSNWSSRDRDELELSLTQEGNEKYVKVKECGVRMVYRKDLEDIQLVESVAVSATTTAAADGSIANGSIVKRKRNVRDEEADVGPPPKRMRRFLEFIMDRLWKKH
ncbi:hypothetical protein V6N12_061849 [Hibiscus sabdariffa]|uniref:TIR domain-containing protein n=1 Tax=Hibiscus sabdariffa TaxID=183260 RepID=A0ABR2DYL3_9ROSI